MDVDTNVAEVLKEHEVPCGLCGKPTRMTGTKRCNSCWELEMRVEMHPDVAAKVLERLGYIVTNVKGFLSHGTKAHKY